MLGVPWQFCSFEIKCEFSVDIIKMFPTKLKVEEYREENLPEGRMLRH